MTDEQQQAALRLVQMQQQKREKALDAREAELLERADRLQIAQEIVLAWPTVLAALRRRGILTDADANKIRYATERQDDVPSLTAQIERALQATLQDRDAKKKRLGEG